MLEIGDPFPAFNLPDQDGLLRSNTEFAGKPYVVYFYPRDDTGGCTKEACEFTALAPDFGDVEIIGVSPDTVKSHKKFVEKHSLSITLLADIDKDLIRACDLWVEKTLYGRKYMGVERTTFLIGSDGKIRHIWAKVKPDGHARQVLDRLG